MRSIVLGTALAMMATSAHAGFVIDFTDDDNFIDPPSAAESASQTFSGTPVGDVLVNLSPNGSNQLTNFQDFDGDASNDPFCETLACEQDGFGVIGEGENPGTDDEITFDESQSILVEFDKAVQIGSLSFLYAFKSEFASVTVNDSGSAFSIDAVEDLGDGGPGFVSAGVALTGVTSLLFKAGNTNDDAGSADVALASIEVVPLPAAVWMFGAGLAAVGGTVYRRRRA